MYNDIHTIIQQIQSVIIFVVMTIMRKITLKIHFLPVGGVPLSFVYNDNCDNRCQNEPKVTEQDNASLSGGLNKAP